MTGRTLRGEKLSIGSPSPALADVSVRDLAAACREAIGTVTIVMARVVPGLLPAVSFGGAIALWVAPALLLSRYPPDQLLDALARVALKPTSGELLTLALVLTYVVLTGLMLGRVTKVPRRTVSRALLRLAVAPLVAVSLVAACVAAVPLFFGALVMCFPNLI